MTPSRRVTQNDVARAAGVNRATVSLAMRNHSSIPERTRRRIQDLADQLGYRPDPMLSALAAYRNSGRPPEYRGTLAWLAQTTPDFPWRKIGHFSTYLEAARQRAEFHGYRLDLFDLGEQRLSLARVTSILKSRGIAGVLLCPQPFPETNLASVPWADFAAVTFGYSVTQPLLHSVAPAQFRAALRTMRELRARGYERIGFAIGRGHDERTDHNYLGGYLAGRELQGTRQPVPPFLFEHGDPQLMVEMLATWFRQHRPDAIVVGGDYLRANLVSAGIHAPDDVGLACPMLSGPDSDLSGVWEANHLIGEAAVDMLVSMLHRGERGVPAQPQRLLVEGVWVEGGTLREPVPR